MMGGGMGDMMDEMMQKMGAPKPKDLYPSLMSLPDQPLEKREELLSLAQDRMHSGTSLMTKSLEELSQATSTENYSGMQAAVTNLREGLAQFDSGLATKRALVEGTSPRNVAIQWFKQEMNLSPQTMGSAQNVLGGRTFHLTVIALLGTFTIAMVWMYFLKMRRASALLKQLASTSVAAPVSNSPPEDPKRQSFIPETENTTSEPTLARPPEFPLMKSISEPLEKWSGPLRICRIFQETPDVKTFRFAAEDEVNLPFTYYPGQFLTLSLQIDGKTVKRSYTIASTPTQLHYCEITVKREEKGLVSRHLHDAVQEGNLLEVTGPNGKFTFTGDSADSIVLIGGGVGITPLMSVVRYLMDVGWGKDVYLLYSCRTTHDFIFRNELERLQERHSNLHVFATMTRSAGTVWMGMKGRFTADIIGHLVPGIANRRIHACGPAGMMEGVMEMLNSLQVPENQIHTEAFGPAKKPDNAPPITKEPNKEQSTATVLFKSSGLSAPISAGETVLEVAESAGVEIDNSCRFGQCGMCKVKLISGEVSMECEDALSDEEKKQKIILACQARAKDSIVVEA
ncbi:MAG: 2Fe-2S iron-sulfur cluster binding domain-containing protein [Verrucomicrobiae bacterium]|nr:2Fe-2S iron-sulfur cluster binding domain-containing protein [Verrucomicrobiae bacterium]